MYLTVVLDPEERPFSVFIRRMLTFPMFIIMGILVAFIASVSVSDKKNNETAQILANQIDDQVRYYEKLIKINDDIRGFRHDFKNHLICLRSLLNSGLTSQAIEYLDDIEHISSVTTDKYKTGNIIVDSLLDDKSDKAATVSATIEFSGFVPTIGISNADICIILSNALDNAIEACERNGGGIINIKSDFRQGYFFLEISNPVPVDVKIQNTQRLTTSKRDKNIHGFGMLNIYKTAEKYNGNSKATAENGVFTLNVELQLSDEFSSI
ncbi:MAG: GHKL domain-containing protein [Ruminococcus sp.]|nr:GHKL domain-containing protein [Ruminococcus sp.]